MATGQPYRFYAAEPLYFAAKVRPCFRCKAIPSEEILPTPTVYRDLIQARTGLAFIPVVVTPDDVTLQDTSDILDELERRLRRLTRQAAAGTVGRHCDAEAPSL